jgi:hypothetical protein
MQCGGTLTDYAMPSTYIHVHCSKPDAASLPPPQGHFQIIMSRKYCPLFRSRLDWLSRMLYCSGVWSYVINAFTTPIFMAVPIITIWVGEQQ